MIPSSPPVSPRGFVWTMTFPACANASVTIANAIPVTRRLTAPSTSGTAIATTARRASAAGRLQSHSVRAIAGHVDAEREVERVPEREQAREAEEEVVRQRDARRRSRQSASSWSVPGESSGPGRTRGMSTESNGTTARTASTHNRDDQACGPASVGHLRSEPLGAKQQDAWRGGA